eukprot:CAMPEP_0202732378 /NCGR_PEP_ID=MMETSP1385-20130828/187627_1 /ASSEMBLY_ACC=CAM_ASM_000861 /TAXON_ID=933848 /ORGANISM="Elphidium margaritaceum" /LENGTH=174 /DNA_ID=CAMNT_0049398687 /DNA_START=347 /DNA_END=868 /DNA_ORIENTATION=-
MDSMDAGSGGGGVVGVVGGMSYAWQSCKYVMDALWFNMGKPLKHSYDFFRYIRSEVGVVVGICIRKCCKKSKENIQNAGKKILLNATKNRRPSYRFIRGRKEKEKDSEDDTSDESGTKSDNEIILRQHRRQRLDCDDGGQSQLRYRHTRQSKSEQLYSDGYDLDHASEANQEEE